ncbi:short-chain dehydrogenase [Actinobacteria bacterium YIM 96077]|uniref:Short-chain dehydrogenase n=1 Tax=Phytoactinopolyspora halophila TaxID=1981511 RepID=A0A329QED8_9ACTN|nr:beta-ketoacyl synthase N-terminal-like domain-containing protein [Phytoactinopolyspora halophila]AYY14152.1 short-chain dehydrogenase [Actinobacteria bacterium YIM 96077]RAW09592.1 short-chain dehydrogenase [Phytoactinopolyspora halophila]
MTDEPGKDTKSLLKESLLTIRDLRNQLHEARSAPTEPVAIIGMGCRFPGGCDSPEQFWTLLTSGGEGVIDIPEDRWDVDAGDDRDSGTFGSMYVTQGNFVQRDLAEFDARFFRMAPAEANALDPQQRQLLEVCWESLENAGQNPQALRGSKTGVFLGIGSNSEYGMLPRDEEKINQYHGTGTSSSTASGRISYEFGWNGPAVSIDTACSSSLVSTHLAVESLRRGECSMAIAGGVSLMLSPYVMSTLCMMNALSTDGRSRPFDRDANGYGRGEGCGLVVLKRLSDAERDGDTIYGVVRGSAVNNDGASSGLTVPSGRAQRMLIEEALDGCSIAPEDVGFLETHGTGTPLGDPIEIDALAEIFDGRHGGAKRDEPLYLGSVKGNIGHLESAAGVASLIKTVLCVYHGEIPQIANSSTLNPRIDLEKIPAELPQASVAWSPSDGRERIAGISSFGFSGTNAHVVVSQPPAVTAEDGAAAGDGAHAEEGTDVEAELPAPVLCLSAKEETSLVEMIRRYEQYLAEHPDTRLEQLCYVANVRRPSFAHRAVFLGDSVASLRSGLQAALAEAESQGTLYGTSNTQEAGETNPRIGLWRTSFRALHDGTVYTAKAADQVQPKLAFVLSGEFEDCRNSARELAATFPAFGEYLDHCLELCSRHVGESLAEAVDGAADGDGVAPVVAEAYLFAYQYAVTSLLDSLGIRPEIVLGERSGQLVAAIVAGIMNLEGAVRILAAAQAARGDGAEGHESAPGLRAVLEDVELSRPRCRFVTVARGAEVSGDEAMTPSFWEEALLKPQRLGDAFDTLYDQGYRNLVEVGASPGLLESGADVHEKPDVIRFELGAGASELDRLAQHLAKLTCLGLNVHWKEYYAGRTFGTISLPNYPFEKTRFWITPPSPDSSGRAHEHAQRAARGHGLDGERIDLPAGPAQYEFICTLRNFPELEDNSGVLHMGYYLEMLTRSLRELYPGRDHVIRELDFVAALNVASREVKRVLLSLEPSENGEIKARFFSKTEGQAWNLHVQGIVEPAGTDPDVPPSRDLDQLELSGAEQQDGGEFYGVLERRGFKFGPTVRWVESSKWRPGEAVVRFRNATEEEASRTYEIGFHPGVLDSCAQACNVLAPATNGKRKYMIRKLERVAISGTSAQDGLQGYITVDQDDAEASEIAGSVEVRDGAGQHVVSIGRATLKEFDEAKLYDMQMIMEAISRPGSGDEEFLREYAETPDEKKPALVVRHVRDILAEAMEFDDPETMDVDEPLNEMGIDSLIGLQFFNKIKRMFGADIALADLIEANSVRKAAMLVLGLLPGGAELAEPIEEEETAEPVSGVALWVYQPEPEPEAKVRLFCFPHGFGSADMYKDWQQKLGPAIDVCPIKLPGLDAERMKEDTPTDVDEVMVSLEEALSGSMFDLPGASFGHSWGSLFAYRLASRLAANPEADFIRLFVSGYTAPVVPNTSTMRIVEELKGLGFSGIPDYEEVRATNTEYDVAFAFIRAWDQEADFEEYALEGARLTLPTLLSAYRLVEKYSYDPGESFDVPIVGFHGLDDNRVTLEEMTAWEQITTGSYTLNTLAGDHGFIDEGQSEHRVIELIRAELEAYAAG